MKSLRQIDFENFVAKKRKEEGTFYQYHKSNLNTEELKFMREVDMLERKFWDFVEILNSNLNRVGPKIKAFPTKTKICSSGCEKEASLCLEISKVE